VKRWKISGYCKEMPDVRMTLIEEGESPSCAVDEEHTFSSDGKEERYVIVSVEEVK